MVFLFNFGHTTNLGKETSFKVNPNTKLEIYTLKRSRRHQTIFTAAKKSGTQINLMYFLIISTQAKR